MRTFIDKTLTKLINRLERFAFKHFKYSWFCPNCNFSTYGTSAEDIDLSRSNHLQNFHGE